MTPPSCGRRHQSTHHGQPVTLRCSALPGHPGLHQAYYCCELHSWPDQPKE